MQLCGKCGEHNTEDSAFCTRCGNKLNNKCPDCGFPNLPRQQFCGSCGKQLGMETELPPSAVNYGRREVPEVIPSGEIPETPSVRPAEPIPIQEIAAATLARGRQASITAPMPAPAQPLEPAAPPRGLSRYALISVEIVGWEQVQSRVSDPADFHEAMQSGVHQVQALLTDAGAAVHVAKNGVVFAAFDQSSSFGDSLTQAVEAARRLIDQPMHLHGVPVQLRIGMDLEDVQQRDPLTSTLERSVATPGTIVVSERVYHNIRTLYKTEPVGPLTMGGRTMTFYRIRKPSEAAVPEIAAPVTVEPPAPPEPPVMEATEPEVSPLPDPTELLLPIEPEVPAEETPPEADEPVPEAEAPAPAEAPAGLPPLPELETPVLGMRRAMREPNLNYQQTLEALETELSGFLSQDVRNKGRLVALCGADGLGKSNLLTIARSRVDGENQRAFWLGAHHYRSLHRNPLPLFYWLELVQNLMGLAFEGHVARQVKEQVSQFLCAIYGTEEPPEEAMGLLSDLLSLNPPQPLTVESRFNLGRLEDFLLGFFRQITAQKPVILVMEDLEFADTASLDLLSRLIEKGLLELPVLVLLTQSRDFYAEGRLLQAMQRHPYKELIVANMDAPALERFLDQGPLGGNLSEFPLHLIDLLVNQAKGLPVYLEEALRLLFLQEHLSVNEKTGKFVMAKEYVPGDIELPMSLGALILRRLDFLTPDGRYLLQMAAVLGEKFSVSLLHALSQLGEEEFKQGITLLFHHGFIEPQTEHTARFRHGLLWQTVYEDIEPDVRMQMHQLISESLENDFKQSFTINPMLIAFHAEQGQLPRRALNYWNFAGIYAGTVGSLVAMNLAMGRALQLMRETSVEPLHTQELALRTVESLGIFNLDDHPDAAVGMLEWVVACRRHAGAHERLLEPLTFLASANESRGDFSAALAALDEALSYVDAKTYPLEAGSLLLTRMEYLFTLGRLQQARELIEQTLDPLAARQNPQQNPDFFDSYLNAYLIKAQILLAQANMGMFDVIDQGLRLAREQGLDGLAIALQLVKGQGDLRRGLYEECDRAADGLLQAIEALDHSEWFLAQWGLLAMLYHCELQDWESASQLILTVTSKSEEARDYHTVVLAQTYAGYITAQQGNTHEGCRMLEQALGLSADYRFASCALTGWRFLSEAELMRGNREVAAEIAAKALDIAQKPDIQNRYEQMKLGMLLARAHVELGHTKEAGKLLEGLWPQVVKTRFQPLIAECAFEIGRLYRTLGEQASPDQSRKHLVRSVEFLLKAKGIWLELRHLKNVRSIDAMMPKL